MYLFEWIECGETIAVSSIFFGSRIMHAYAFLYSAAFVMVVAENVDVAVIHLLPADSRYDAASWCVCVDRQNNDVTIILFVLFLYEICSLESPFIFIAHPFGVSPVGILWQFQHAWTTVPCVNEIEWSILWTQRHILLIVLGYAVCEWSKPHLSNISWNWEFNVICADGARFLLKMNHHAHHLIIYNLKFRSSTGRF